MHWTEGEETKREGGESEEERGDGEEEQGVPGADGPEGGEGRLKKAHSLQRRVVETALHVTQRPPGARDLSGTISRVRGKERVESFGR